MYVVGMYIFGDVWNSMIVPSNYNNNNNNNNHNPTYIIAYNIPTYNTSQFIKV